jgi:hypothetical protein
LSLVVDNFGIKYAGKKHTNHLITRLKEKYKLSEDLARALYCGITLKWDYLKHTLNISLPGYVKKQLLKYNHIMLRTQHYPYALEPKIYGANAQSPIPHDNSQKLTDNEVKKVHQTVGCILYYARAVDMTVLMALSIIASE